MPTLSNPSLEQQSTLNVSRFTSVCVPACIDTVCVCNTIMCVCTFTCLQSVTNLSAALNMPLVAWARSSGGQDERKRSSSFIMERMLEAETSARERSNARLESWPERINVGYSVYTYKLFKIRLCCNCEHGAIYFSIHQIKNVKLDYSLFCVDTAEVSIFSTDHT